MTTPAAWWRKVRRRRPGIYLVRTDKHLRPGRENGYVGESVNVQARIKDHLGQGRYGHTAKCWSDLNPRWHVRTLPWWLGWKWVLRPLETVAMLLLWPRYNVAKNRWNPRRIGPSLALTQRANRDHYRSLYGRLPMRYGSRTLQVLGAVFVLAGVAMTVWSNVR